MHLYNLCSKLELLTIAANRRVPVRSSAASFGEPPRNDYIQALKRVDDSWTFRFLDLPAEIRNIVYRELLISRNSTTCFPKILQTCKRINSEASSILYGENIIEVNIHKDGVFVQGERCGNYLPSLHPGHKVEKDQSIPWPNFLRRTERVCLRISLLQNPKPHRCPHIGSLHFVVNSFCKFLRRDHKILSLMVDLNELRRSCTVHGWLQDFEEGVSTVIYPLRLLGPLPDLRVEGPTVALTTILRPTHTIHQEVQKMLGGSRQHLRNQIEVAMCTETTISGLRFRPYPEKMLQTFFKLLTHTGCIYYNLCVEKHIYGGTWSLFFDTMDWLRETWDKRSARAATEEDKRRINMLVKLEVEALLEMEKNEERSDQPRN